MVCLMIYKLANLRYMVCRNLEMCMAVFTLIGSSTWGGGILKPRSPGRDWAHIV